MSTTNEVFRTIATRNAELENQSLSRFACKSENAIRRSNIKKALEDEIRPEFWRDADRILHTAAFSRYIDKTQVFYLFENDHITHRVLHVQLVSKIGRFIARALRLNEDLVEAISLGHDIGHVPYGHDGEKVLDSLCSERKIGAFCHNAQSVRFLMEIENGGSGRDLTLQVLDGILCHNGEILDREYCPNPNKKWSDFLHEYKQCLKNTSFSKTIMPMTLEGCVMRISDIIAYIGRDIEDAIRLNVMKQKEIPPKVVKVLGNNNRSIIHRLVTDLLVNSFDQDRLRFSHKVYAALNLLRNFSSKRIYQFAPVRTETPKIERMFRDLFDQYLDDFKKRRMSSAIFKDHLTLLNSNYQTKTPPARIVVDFISGMTDDYFNNQYKELFALKSYGYALPKNKGIA